MTSSHTPTDKTSCTTTKQPSSKQAITTSTDSNFDQVDVKNTKAFISARGVQVSTYCKTELVHVAKAIALIWTFLQTLTLKMSPLMNVCQDASHFQQDKKFWAPSKWHHCPMTSLSSRHLD